MDLYAFCLIHVFAKPKRESKLTQPIDFYAFCPMHVFTKPKGESEVFSDLLCGLLFSRGKRDFFVQQTQQKTLISWFQRPSWLWKLIFYINHIRAESQGE